MLGWLIGRGLQGRAELLIQAPPDRVFQLVSDVTRMGEWSPECRRCVWLGGATGPALGARFKGYNRHSLLRWGIPCRVTEVEVGRVFAFETTPPGLPVQTHWRYELEPAEGGTILAESFEALWYIRIVVRLLFGGPRARLAQMEDGMRRTLEQIKAAAESS